MTEASENVWMVRDNGVEIEVEVNVWGTERENVFEELDWASEKVEEALRQRSEHD